MTEEEVLREMLSEARRSSAHARRLREEAEACLADLKRQNGESWLSRTMKRLRRGKRK